MTAYKVTDPESKCKGYLFEVGKTYKHFGKIELCKTGFHFCSNEDKEKIKKIPGFDKEIFYKISGIMIED